MGHKIGKAVRPKRGSRAFIPRVRAKRPYPRIKNWPKVDDVRLLGFAAYKAGMAHVTYVDNSAHSPTKGEVITVPVKEGIGNAARMLHPQRARELIKKKAKEALLRLDEFKPFKLKPPYTLEVTYKDEIKAEEMSWFPGAKRTGNTSVAFTSSDWMEILRFFSFGID